MQEVFRPLEEIPDAKVESFIVSQGGPEPVTVRIWLPTSWSLQREPTGEKATLGPRQEIFDEGGTHTFRVCSACGFRISVTLSTVYFGGQRSCFEDRPKTCYGCGATFELPETKEGK